MSSNAITLTAGMRKNLFSLQNTNTLLERTQKRMATGLRVQTAVDDPVNYFTALGHRQRAEDLGSRKDEMAESIQTAMAANEGVTAITSLIASAKSLAQSALSAATQEEIQTLESQYNEVLSQIDSMAADSGYKGVNLLQSDTHEVKFDETGDSSLTMVGFDATTASTGLDIASLDAVYTDAVAASGTTGAAADNDEIVWTAVTGGATGPSITIEDGAAADDPLSISVASDGAITITLARNTANDANTTTAAQLIDAVNNHAEASQIVTAEAGGGDGSAVVTGGGATVTFAGGVDAAVTGTGWWSPNADGTGSVDKVNIRANIAELDSARTTLRSEAQKLSTNLSTITIRQDFTKGMINTLEDGAAELTNADMNQEGANMLMLQTRQSLGTTSLSLASQAAQSVLRLF